MLLLTPLDYYRHVRERFANSYFTEDNAQVILGIDCRYFDSANYDYHNLQKIYAQQKSIAPFAGLFGIFAYESVHFFEEIAPIEKAQYAFPNFLFADAKAYLHYDKIGKNYSFYGDKSLYYAYLQELSETPLANAAEKPFWKITTSLQEQQEHFYRNIEIAKEYIRRGDIFQVVLSEQLMIETNLDSLQFYQALSRANPSPYMFHFPTPYGDAVGSSPEILLEIKHEQMFIAPVAGTRPRGKDVAEDERLGQELLSDEKELAEHRMLIDLARNDIGRFAKKFSVVVKNPMHIQYYQHVMHIVSEVYGKKREEVSLFDVIQAAFPAGTLSGTPKIRAMQIINELEEYKRNIYGGGIGFLHYSGDVQLAILIRSAFFADSNDAFAEGAAKKVFVQAGAGIVYDSLPQNEYQEILHKRASMINIFAQLCREEK